MFLVNSRLGLFTATPASTRSLGPAPARAPLLPKLRGHVAEFLSEGSPVHLGRVLPAHQRRFAVRSYGLLARGFSWRYGSPSLQVVLANSPPPLPQALCAWICLRTPPTQPHARCPFRVALVPPRVPPSLKRTPYGAGILTCSPSTTPCGLALGPTSPGWIILAQEPSGLRWQGFSPCFYATHTGIRTRTRSTHVPT